MTKIALSSAFMLAAASALLGADSKTVDKTLALPLTGSAVIEAHNGSITMHTWDKPQIQIHARIEMNPGWSSRSDRRRFNETRVDIDSTKDSVKIRSIYPDWSLGPMDNPNIYYTITAPRTVKWTIRDHNSTIDVHDVHAALSIFTHNSQISVDGLAGALELDTHNGNAHVQFASFTAPSSVETHNANVELVLPAKSNLNLVSHSHNARLQTDLPLTTRIQGQRGQDVDGTINGGGPALSLSSHNGNFRIRAN